MVRSGSLRFVVVVVALIGAAACGGGYRTSPPPDGSAALQRAVDAANRRYGPEWQCQEVVANRLPTVDCQKEGEDSFSVDEFRIVRGVALYWNGVRVSAAARFVPYIAQDYKSQGARKTACRIARASLPYRFRCRLDGAQTAWVSVDLDGEMSLPPINPNDPPATMGFGLGLP
jgi:hypothetical protein